LSIVSIATEKREYRFATPNAFFTYGLKKEQLWVPHSSRAPCG
jgi:hypothetical protein